MLNGNKICVMSVNYDVAAVNWQIAQKQSYVSCLKQTDMIFALLLVEQVLVWKGPSHST